MAGLKPVTTADRGTSLRWSALSAGAGAYDRVVTEDETPVDNLASEKGQRMLTEPLYSSWPGPGDGRPFLAAANVGLYRSPEHQPVVPDVLLSLDVTVPDDWWARHNRVYFLTVMGKPPEVAIEIVSGQGGNEYSSKQGACARTGVEFYVVFDPAQQIQSQPVRVFRLRDGDYTPYRDRVLNGVGLGLVLWDGVYEGKQATWLRWCDADGVLLPTGRERAERAERRAENAERRAERLAARLHELGVDPDA